MAAEPIRRQSVISLFNILGLTVLGYFATMYFAHVLGPAVLGSYYLFLAYYGIFSLIGDGGFGGAAAKRISEGKEPDAFFGAYILLRVLLLVCSVIGLLVLSPLLIDFLASGLLPWLVLALVAGTFAGIVSTGVYGTAKVGVAQVSDFLNNAVRIFVQILATYFGYAVAGLAGGFIAGICAGIIVNYHYLPLRLGPFGKSHLKSLFSFSFWIFLTSGGLLIFSTADTILIGYFLSNADVGVYRVAYQLTGAALFISSALNMVLFPRMSGWSSNQEFSRVGNALGKAFTFSLLLAVPVVAGGLILGDLLLYYLYGAPFVAGALAFNVLLFVQIASLFTALFITSLNALNTPRISFMATFIAAVLNIILNILLIPFIGILGAALATLISLSLNAVLAHYYLSRMISISWEKRSLMNILGASAVMSMAVLLFKVGPGISSILSLIGVVAIGAGIYFLVLFRLDRHIRNELRDLIRDLGGV